MICFFLFPSIPEFECRSGFYTAIDCYGCQASVFATLRRDRGGLAFPGSRCKTAPTDQVVKKQAGYLLYSWWALGLHRRSFSVGVRSPATSNALRLSLESLLMRLYLIFPVFVQFHEVSDELRLFFDVVFHFRFRVGEIVEGVLHDFL